MITMTNWTTNYYHKLSFLFILFCLTCGSFNYLTIICLQPVNGGGQFQSASVLIEGCLDDSCLAILTKNYHSITKCFDPLRQSIIADDEEYSLKLCCNVAKYEQCIFPYVISYCGLNSLDKFENELRSFNSICNIATLQWNKCQSNKTIPIENDLELRE